MKVDAGTLEGRVAIVTGGARGIGAAISTLLVARGVKVVVADNGAAIDGRDADPSVAQGFAAGLGTRAAKRSPLPFARKLLLVITGCTPI